MILVIDLERLSFIVDRKILEIVHSMGLGKKTEKYFVFPVMQIIGQNNWNLLCQQSMMQGYHNIMITY